MAIFRDAEHESEYLQLHNSTVNSYDSLSLEAMGALVYWLAKPKGWNPSVSELAKTWGFGREKAARIMRELKRAGYVKKSGARSKAGRFVTTELHVFETPRSDSEVPEPTRPDNVVEMPVSGDNRNTAQPQTGNPSTVEPSTVLPPTINNRVIEKTDSKKTRSSDDDPLFDECWKGWPRKVKKPEARKAWAKVKDKQATLEAINENLRLRHAAGQWRDIRYIPHPATYLNARQWEDVVYDERQRDNGKRTVEDILSSDF